MIEQLITSETRIKLLLKFFVNPRTRSYMRKLATEFGESTNGIRVELNRLTKAHILNVSSEGRNKLYEANHSHPLFDEIRAIVLKSTGIDKVVSDIIDKLGAINLAFIRGNYATGEDNGLIDLVVVGDKINTQELERVRKKTEQLIDRKISVLMLNYKEYLKLESNFTSEATLVLLNNTRAKL